MASRQLLGGEAILASWTIKRKGRTALLVLTNLRVWLEVQARGMSDMTSIAVDEVQWAAVGRRHSPLLLVLAAILVVLGVIGGLAMDSPAPIALGVVLGLVLVILYLLGRHGEVVIAGGTGVLRQHIGGTAKDQEEALAFVGKVEERAVATRDRLGGAPAVVASAA